MANFNASEVEEDLYEDMKHDDYSSDIPGMNTLMIRYIVFTGLIVVLAIVVIAADIFLICTICRFKRLKVRTNMYILNCCILNILYIISLPTYYFIALILQGHFTSCWKSCTLNVFLILYVVFAFALVLDWFLSGCIPNIMKKFNKFYKYVFVGLYVVFFIEGLIAMDICSETHTMTRYYILNALYVISFVAVVILNILSKKITLKNNSYRTAYSLTVTNIIIFSFLPFPIFNILEHFLPVGGNFFWLIAAESIPVLIALAHPILVVYMLGKQNKYFKMAYNRSFKRCVKSYADENLDEESDDEKDIGNGDAKINNFTAHGNEPDNDTSLI